MSDNPSCRRLEWPDWSRCKLTPRHAAVYQSRARRQIVNAGRAFGKDHLHQLRALRFFFELYAVRKADPGWRRLGPVVHLCVAGPTSTNFEDLWRRVKDLLPDIPGVAPNGQPNIHVKEKDQQIEILGKNEMLISFGSVFRPNNVRGGGFDILLATECGYMTEQTVKNLFKLVIRPGYAGVVMLNSTPLGPGHWWDAAIRQARTGRGYWGRWELLQGTYLDNPMTTASDIEEAKAEKEQNVYSYRRERLAWVDVDVPDDALLGEGQQRAFESGLIDGMMIREKHDPHGPFYVGCDLAGTGPDPLIVCVVDSSGVIVHLERHARTGDEEIVALLERVHEYWKPIALTYDASGPIGKRLGGRLARIRAVPLVPGREGTSKDELVKHVIQHMINKSVRLPHPEWYPFTGKFQRENASGLLRELRSYRKFELARERMNSGRVTKTVFTTYSKPVDGTDDFVDALVYALHPRRVPMVVGNTAMSDSELGW